MPYLLCFVSICGELESRNGLFIKQVRVKNTKAIVVKKFGNPPEMVIEERPRPTLKNGFTLVRRGHDASITSDRLCDPQFLAIRDEDAEFTSSKRIEHDITI